MSRTTPNASASGRDAVATRPPVCRTWTTLPNPNAVASWLHAASIGACGAIRTPSNKCRSEGRTSSATA